LVWCRLAFEPGQHQVAQAVRSPGQDEAARIGERARVHPLDQRLRARREIGGPLVEQARDAVDDPLDLVDRIDRFRWRARRSRSVRRRWRSAQPRQSREDLERRSARKPVGGGGREKSTSPASPPRARMRGGSACRRGAHSRLAGLRARGRSSRSAIRPLRCQPPSSAASPCAPAAGRGQDPSFAACRQGAGEQRARQRTKARPRRRSAVRADRRSRRSGVRRGVALPPAARRSPDAAALRAAQRARPCKVAHPAFRWLVFRSRATSFSAASGCALAGSAKSGGIAVSVASAASGRRTGDQRELPERETDDMAPLRWPSSSR
jgi:hypothetical protein